MHNDEDELITVKAACRILGGEERYISPPTIAA